MPIFHAGEHVEKRLSARERSEPEAIARLRSEAILLGLLSDADCGVTPQLLAHGEDEAGPWHRIERIALPTVAERLAAAQGCPLDPVWIERAAEAGFRALARLHDATDASGPLHVVHADLSPSNVAIDDHGSRLVLLDLDLAWWRDGPSRDGAFRGTIAYAAPETTRGEPPTVQTDLFSLAAIFLHCATGRPPRTGASFAALLASAAEMPLAVADAVLGGPSRRAVVGCLAHHPPDRPRSAHEVLTSWATKRDPKLDRRGASRVANASRVGCARPGSCQLRELREPIPSAFTPARRPIPRPEPS
jgi:serine/threonine protein kinase